MNIELKKKGNRYAIGLLILLFLTALAACGREDAAPMDKSPLQEKTAVGYVQAVQQGYTGTQDQWLALLSNQAQRSGLSAYARAVDAGYQGTEQDWLILLTEEDTDYGQIPYDLAVQQGYSGTKAEWLCYLVGAPEISSSDIQVEDVWINTEGHLILKTEEGTKMDAGAIGAQIPTPFPQSVQYTVQFLSWDGTLLETQKVQAGQDAILPDGPKREGYVFIGWDQSSQKVTGDLILTAQYVPVKTPVYTVTFTDSEGAVLEKQQVPKGKDARLPINPVQEGKYFAGWEGTYQNIKADQTVKAQFVSANADNILQVSEASGVPGETIKVMLGLEGTVRMCQFDMVIGFDPNLLEIVSVDGDFDLSVIYNPSQQDGAVLLCCSNAMNRTKRADVMEMAFKIKEGVTKTEAHIFLKEMKMISRINDAGDGVTDVPYVFLDGVVHVV